MKKILTHIKILLNKLFFYLCTTAFYFLVDIKVKPIRNLFELLLVGGMLIYAIYRNSWTCFWIAFGYVTFAKTIRIIALYVFTYKKNLQNKSDESKNE